MGGGHMSWLSQRRGSSTRLGVLGSHWQSGDAAVSSPWLSGDSRHCFADQLPSEKVHYATHSRVFIHKEGTIAGESLSEGHLDRLQQNKLTSHGGLALHNCD